MEQLLTNDRQIAYHRNQINPEKIPNTKLTFSFADKYCKLLVSYLFLVKLVHELEGTFHCITTQWEFDDAVDDGSKKPKKVTTLVKKKLYDNGLRTKVLMEVNEDYHDAAVVSNSLESGMIEQLIVCFGDEDNTIWELASRAIMQVAHVERGRDYIIAHNLIVNVVKLFEDRVVKIRSNAYITLQRLADFLTGIDAIIDNEVNVI